MSTVESPKIRIAGKSGCVLAFADALQNASIVVVMKRVKVMVSDAGILFVFFLFLWI